MPDVALHVGNEQLDLISGFGRGSEADGCGGLSRRDANDPNVLADPGEGLLQRLELRGPRVRDRLLALILWPFLTGFVHERDSGPFGQHASPIAFVM